MNILENNTKIQKKIFLDKLTPDKEEIQSNKNTNSSDFNLEYQKYKFPPDNHAKFTKEFQKLIQFVKESNIYRDINGNKITKKGKLLLTPYQKIRKLNEEIKTYYENKIHKKKSQLIIKNFKNKDEPLYKILNFNSERKKIIPINRENINKMKISSHDKNKEENYQQMKKMNLKIKINNELKPIKIYKDKSTNNNLDNFLCLTNTANNHKTKYFNDSEFNQINFWKAKIIKLNSLRKTHYLEKTTSKSLGNKKIITEYNNKKIKKSNTPTHKTINIKKNNRNKIWIESKTFEETNLDKCKYKLLQFNLHQLIKPSPKYKGKIVLNIKTSMTDIKKNDNKEEEKIEDFIKMENKIISVNMDDSESKV